MANTLHTQNLVPGPPGQGVAWAGGVRALSQPLVDAYMFWVWGVGPFKTPTGPIVPGPGAPADRIFVPGRSLGAQFDQCITNLTAILAAITPSGQGPPGLADIMACWCHIGESYYASLGEVDSRWSSFGASPPARILVPGHSAEGVMVEIDVQGIFNT